MKINKPFLLIVLLGLGIISFISTKQLNQGLATAQATGKSSWNAPSQTGTSSLSLAFLPIISTPGDSSSDPVIIAAGDIATCNSAGDDQTALLLDGIAGTVLTLGDNVYEYGTVNEFNDCYAPTWGRHKERTRPSVGNHEYKTAGAAGYFSYFGSSAGDPQEGYYSFDIGEWHIISLNANCLEIGGCGEGSPQLEWLRSDLAAHPELCSLAYWHQPLFSSGTHGNDSNVLSIWQALYDSGVDVVLNGHDHDYERFAPQDPAGELDPQNGIREFVVGTGGKDLRAIGTPISNSLVQNDNTWGVLKLVLHPDSYTWQFIPVAGKTFSDQGTGYCH